VPTELTSASSAALNRSTFVTAVAWIFIALAGFATFISLLQALMFTLVSPAAQFPPFARTSPPFQEMPLILRFMMQNVHMFFVAFWSLAALTLLSAIGFLRRKNWARLVFIALMVMGITWTLGGLWLQEQMTSAFSKLPQTDPPEMASRFETMMTVMRVAMGAFAIGTSLVMA